VIITGMNDRRVIAHMPGAGGNFMVRVLEQGHQTEPIPEAQYPEWLRRRRPTEHDWVAWEQSWRWSEHYEHLHEQVAHAWLRITVATPREWRWAQANALWKNTDLRGMPNSQTASDPGRPADHHIALETLWHWRTLAPQLERLQRHPTNPHQQSLHQQWRLTWCPHTDQARYQALCDRLFQAQRPPYIR
jgi:hypothetical protein